MDINRVHSAFYDIENEINTIRRKLEGITKEDGVEMLELFRNLRHSVLVAGDVFFSELFDKEEE